jgi:3-hydroxy-5-methyl-1-naphthoate 3-O-methyltransferase
MAFESKNITSSSIDLMKMADSYRVSRIFLTAVELHIFETLSHQELTAEEISNKIDTNAPATEILLNALVGLELLEKHEGKYANSSIIMKMLRNKCSESLLAWFRHQNNNWQKWSELTQIVKSGCLKKKYWSQEMSIDLAMTLRLGAKSLAERLDLMIDFSNIHRICDMGCGPGTVTMELLKIHPHMSAVLIDNDNNALEIARQDAKINRLHGRIKLVNQNIITIKMEEEFDLVIMSLVLCLFSRQEVLHLLNKVKAILHQDGTLILGEILLNESKTSPVSSTLFAVQLLINGLCDGSFSLTDIIELFSICGIRYERNFPTNFYHIIVGKNEYN